MEQRHKGLLRNIGKLGSGLGQAAWEEVPLYSRQVSIIWSGFWKFFFFNIFYLFIFRQRGREGEREGEKHQCVVCLLRTSH